MASYEFNGWAVRFIEPFKSQHNDLVEQVQKLKGKLTEDEFKKHRSVKQLAALRKAYTEVIPNDPFASRFALKDSLQNFSRLKKCGIGDRYRLFFKVFPDKKEIWLLWLGYPRIKGGKRDCYEVFKQMVEKGKFPESVEELMNET